MIGVIKGIRGGNGGILTIEIEHEDGKRVFVHADNAPAIRAFEAAFAGVIKPGHLFDANAIIGQRIDYTVDEIGLMTGFDPA
jgi:hypothetical protein